MQKGKKGRNILRRAIVAGAAAGLLTIGAIAGLNALNREEGAAPLAQASSELTTKKDLRQILDAQAFNNLTEREVELQVGKQILKVETSLDTDLQNYLLQRMDRENSRYVGIVVMEADTGRVLAMAGFDRTDPAGNPCLSSQYPAASIFKIVTAASAVDQCGYAADSPVHFNGGKHTLYKQQLTDKTNRYTTTVSFSDAFAQSVNPVFGKLGEQRLGKPLLEKSAEAFGFNTPLDFELHLPPSRFQVDEHPYHWAEVASGFNLDTTISPLHGAMIASAVLNGGRMAAPSIVERIVDGEGEVQYLRQPGWTGQAMSAKASAALGQMMEDTVTSGTARKTFRDYRKDEILSRLQIGGKTGSIGSRDHDVRFDWFVGFAREREGKGQLAMAVVVAHEKYIGIRAAQYARMAITHYFGKNTRQGT